MKFKSLYIALLLLPLNTLAQSYIGYSNETVNRNNVFRYTSSTDQRLAMRLSSEKLSTLKGQTIKAIRIAFGSKNSTGNKATLFLTESLTGKALSQQTVSITSTNKLVEYALSTPYTITGEEKELYVGCQMEIAANYGPFSSDFSKDLKETFFAYSDGQWYDLYGKGYGCPNIEVVTSESVTLTDVVLKPFEENGYVKQNAPLAYSLQVQNFGTSTINSFDAVVQIGNGHSKTFSFTNCALAPHKTYDLKLEGMAAEHIGKQAISVNITNVNGQTDDEQSDNTQTANAYFYPTDMQKSVLLEVFTGQTCTNCPSAHTAIGNALKQATDVDVVEIAHHSGFVTDIFTMKEDWTLAGLYNNSTYAPAVMYNRTAPSTEASSPVQECAGAADVVSKLRSANNERPYVSMNLQSHYDEATREVNLTCNFYTHEPMPGDDLRYSIWLVQDSLVASQKGATADYVHNAVSRGCLTESAWGEVGTFTPGETLEVKKTFTLPEIINSTSYEKEDGKNAIATVLKDMKLVVFVHQQSSNDVTECRVFNCAEVGLNGSTVQGGFPELPTEGKRVLLHQTYYGDVQGGEAADVATRTIDYCYNADNKVLRSIETSKNTGEDVWTLTHYYKNDYDEKGLLTRSNSLQYGSFDYDQMGYFAPNDTITYQYNAEGQLITEQHPLKYYTYQYNAEGQLTERSTWNINSISRQASNDLVETYSDFNTLGQPCTVTATSPTGKEWNEYTGQYTYDADGNILSKKHFSTEADHHLTYAEYWTYEDGRLTEHRLPTVFDDGQEVENEKEIFTLVDGNPDKVQHEVLLYEGNDTWSKMAGSLRIDEYGYVTSGDAPQLFVSDYDGGINTVGVWVEGTTGSDVRFYRSGILLSETTDLLVKNGTYEYLAVVDGKASNIVEHTFATPLPPVSDIHFVSSRKDFEGNTYVTIGWTNPDYTLMPYVTLPFQSHNIFFENMRSAEATTEDGTATQLEANFGTETALKLFVQTRYAIGYVNSETITIDLGNTAIEDMDAETEASLKQSQNMYTLSGQQISRPTKGVYIKGGKKVLR